MTRPTDTSPESVPPASGPDEWPLACFYCDERIRPGSWMTSQSLVTMLGPGGKITGALALDQACPACSAERDRIPQASGPDSVDRCFVCARPAERAVWQHVTADLNLLGTDGQMHVPVSRRIASVCERCSDHSSKVTVDFPIAPVNGKPGRRVVEVVDEAIKQAARPPGASGPPRAVMVTGGVAAGKTRFRRGEFGQGFVSLDPADLYLALTRDEAEVPRGIRERLDDAGRTLAHRALSAKLDVVFEHIPWNQAWVEAILKQFKSHGYHTEILHLHCDEDTALARNENRIRSARRVST